MNINSFININKFYKSLRNFNKKKPFPYIVLDGFLKKDIALKIEKNFIKLQDKKLWSYDNFCEIKKATDNWNFFPPLTYKVFSLLNSNQTAKFLSKKLKIPKVIPDYGYTVVVGI